MEDQPITYQVRFDANDLHFRAAVENVNVESRTFDVVFATETPVPKMDWNRYVIVDEILEISQEAIDSSRIAGPSGVPFLDNHNQWSGARGIYGVCDGLKISGKKAISTVRMSDRPNDPVLEGMWHDIKTGILRTVSVGYRVSEYEKTLAKEGSGKRDVFRAKKWTPMEISAANVPADHNSIKRTEGKENNPTLPENTVETRSVVTNPEPAIIPLPATEATETRNIPKIMDKTPAELAAEQAAIDLRVQQGIDARELRAAEINEICDMFGLKAETRTEYLKSKSDVNEVRKLAQAEWHKSDPSRGASGGAAVTHHNGAPQLAERMATAILLRSGAISDVDLKPTEVDSAREFRGLDMLRTAEIYLRDNGVNTRNMDNMDIGKAILGYGDHAIRSGGGMVSTDFPTALGSAMNRVLLAKYALAPQTWRAFCTYRNAKDFRSMNSVQIGDAPRLELVPRGGEIRRGFMKDVGESYAIQAYGKIVSLDWRTFVDDDLGVFTDLPAAMAEEVAQLQSDIIYDLLLSNPTLGQDSTAVFHANHGNRAISGAALDNTSIAAAEQRFMEQVSIGTPTTAGRPLNLKPDLLIVGPKNYRKAFDIVYPSGVMLTTGSQSFKGAFEIVSDARITDSRFYLASKSSRVKTIEFSLLEGKNLWTDKEQDFGTSGWNYKVETAFGAAFLDYRGMDWTPTA